MNLLLNLLLLCRRRRLYVKRPHGVVPSPPENARRRRRLSSGLFFFSLSLFTRGAHAHTTEDLLLFPAAKHAKRFFDSFPETHTPKRDPDRVVPFARSSSSSSGIIKASSTTRSHAEEARRTGTSPFYLFARDIKRFGQKRVS